MFMRFSSCQINLFILEGKKDFVCQQSDNPVCCWSAHGQQICVTQHYFYCAPPLFCSNLENHFHRNCRRAFPSGSGVEGFCPRSPSRRYIFPHLFRQLLPCTIMSSNKQHRQLKHYWHCASCTRAKGSPRGITRTKLPTCAGPCKGEACWSSMVCIRPDNFWS